MDSTELKNYLAEDSNRIFKILEDLNCGKIKDNGEYISASFPNGDNPKGINVNKENLSFNSFSRDIKGDIISLCMDIKNIDFYSSIKYLHSLFGLRMSNNKKIKRDEEFDPLSLFKKIIATRYSIEEVEELNKYDENVLNDYYPYLTKDWIVENGILELIRDRFDLGYSQKFNRIVIPHRHHTTGDIIGVIGRTINPLYKELDIPKYFPIIKYNKSRNLYGLYENYSDIQKKGYVVVYESEKSVIRRSARGDNTGVALCCKSMSKYQLKILKGLNVEIVLALDNDVKIKEVLEMCDLFYPTHKVSFIKDKSGILKEKDSPADTSIDNFNKLFKNRNTYNESWKTILEKGK